MIFSSVKYMLCALKRFAPCTRWFKYDRDDLCVNKSQFVPVIFEPPCMCSAVINVYEFVQVPHVAFRPPDGTFLSRALVSFPLLSSLPLLFSFTFVLASSLFLYFRPCLSLLSSVNELYPEYRPNSCKIGVFRPFQNSVSVWSGWGSLFRASCFERGGEDRLNCHIGGGKIHL
jgi:hypothetical protein